MNEIIYELIITAVITAIAWVTLFIPATTVRPSGSFAYMFLALLVWIIILPATVLYLSYPFDKLMHPYFFVLKITTLIVSVLAMHYFIYQWYFHGWSPRLQKMLTIVMTSLILVNMVEACFLQMSYYWNAPKDQNNDEERIINVSNAVIGFGLCVVLVRWLLRNYKDGISVEIRRNRIYLRSGFPMIFLLAYVCWNFLFRIQYPLHKFLVGFYLSTLLLPMLCHIFSIGDFLQLRAFSLLIFIVIGLPVVQNGAHILENVHKDTSLRENLPFKYFLLGSGGILTIIGLI